MNRFKLTPEACTDGPFKGYIGIDWINSAAKKETTDRFTHLMHHLNEFNLRQAFRKLDGAKASGIDQITKEEYGKNLTANIENLGDQIRRGGWRPKPSREKLIPKPTGGMRPLAIGCLEDKIVQNLCAKILEAIYEPIFHQHSFGFRPGKDAHQAIARLHQEIRLRKDNCTVVEMDIEKSSFNNIHHEKLMELINLRIVDQHFLRIIKRMLRNSTLSEDGELIANEVGAPQGSPISPILRSTLKRTLKVKTDPKKVAASIQRFKEWIKANRHKHRLAKLWELVATRFRGHYNYYGVTFNEAKMSHYYYACIRELFKWLNRRSQKHSYNWEGFLQRLRFNPLPKPPHGKALIDITNGLGSKLKHKLKSRVREIRTHGSVRSRGWQHPLFT